MGQYKVEDQPDLTIPEDTIVRGTLEELKEKEITWKDKKTGEDKSATLLEWWWKVKGGDYDGRKVKGECDARLTNHPNNRFRLWAEALLNRELNLGVGLDTDDLVGLQADLTVRHDPDKQDPKKMWERVDEVIPISGFDDVPFDSGRQGY